MRMPIGVPIYVRPPSDTPDSGEREEFEICPRGLVERTMQMRRITDTNYCKTHKLKGVVSACQRYTDQALTVDL
jgi:hypothetical protein